MRFRRLCAPKFYIKRQTRDKRNKKRERYVMCFNISIYILFFISSNVPTGGSKNSPRRFRHPTVDNQPQWNNTGHTNMQPYLLEELSLLLLKCYDTVGDIVHYNDVIMGAMVSQITSLTIVYSTVYSGADQRKIKAPRHWPLRGIHRWPVNSPHK